MEYETGKHFTFLGDEPYKEELKIYTENSNWLLHEAFCLYEDREKFKPYQKNHTTAREASEIAKRFKINNLILTHIADQSDMKNRKQKYIEEAKRYYNGNVFVPDDLDEIEII